MCGKMSASEKIGVGEAAAEAAAGDVVAAVAGEGGGVSQVAEHKGDERGGSESMAAVAIEKESIAGKVAGILKGRKRWGKIARMPFEVREWLNEQIRDGAKYADVVAALAVKGYEGCTKFDLSTWKRGGYQDWAREQERVTALQGDFRQLFRVLEKFGEKHTDGVERIAELLIGMQIVRAVQDLRGETLKDLVAEKPELFFRIARAASDQARDRARRKRVGVMVQKYDDQSAAKRAEEERSKIPISERGLSPETLKEIEAAMAQLW
jgi:hypothetical protein